MRILICTAIVKSVSRVHASLVLLELLQQLAYATQSLTLHITLIFLKPNSFLFFTFVFLPSKVYFFSLGSEFPEHQLWFSIYYSFPFITRMLLVINRLFLLLGLKHNIYFG